MGSLFSREFTLLAVLLNMKSGNENFKQHYLDYYAALCYFARRIVGSAEEAEDVVEDVFLKLYQSNKIFSPDDSVSAYLYSATRNESLSHLTRTNRSKERQWRYNSTLPENELSPINAMIESEVLKSVMREIRNLPGKSAKVIELSYMDGLKNAEIAVLLDISEQTVKNLKSKGLSLLKTKLSTDAFFLFCFLYVLH
jgi:RNA polymerase sigma-70 factor (family 1)